MSAMAALLALMLAMAAGEDEGTDTSHSYVNSRAEEIRSHWQASNDVSASPLTQDGQSEVMGHPNFNVNYNHSEYQDVRSEILSPPSPSVLETPERLVDKSFGFRNSTRSHPRYYSPGSARYRGIYGQTPKKYASPYPERRTNPEWIDLESDVSRRGTPHMHGESWGGRTPGHYPDSNGRLSREELSKRLSELVRLGERQDIDVETLLSEVVNNGRSYNRPSYPSARTFDSSGFRAKDSQRHHSFRRHEESRRETTEQRLNRLCRFLDLFSETVADRLGQMEDRFRDGRSSYRRPSGAIRSRYQGDISRDYTGRVPGQFRRHRVDTEEEESEWDDYYRRRRIKDTRRGDEEPGFRRFPIENEQGHHHQNIPQSIPHPSQWELSMSELQQNPFSPSILRSLFPGPWWLWSLAGVLSAYVFFDLGMALTSHI